MTDVSPAQIGKYRIVSVVGEGAMGTVYRAVDSVIGRTVAVKVMNAAIARDKDHRQRFLREAQAAGSLQHPNVVTIYDLGELEGHLFIAMEFLHGADLEKLIGGQTELTLQSKLDIIVDVLMGLSYAHKNGIVHRDIKPANIRVGEDGRAKIMDFGVAHLASSDMTRTGLVVGTPSYMAPEQVTGGKAVPGTDIFAVGAVLYHLLTGIKPFEGPTLQSLFYRIVTDMPRPLDEVRPGLPAALNQILQKAMAKEPADRYATSLDMANDIISVRAGLSGSPYASTASLTGAAVSVVETYSPKSVPVSGGTQRSWKPIAAGAGAAAVVLVAWLAFAGTRNGDDSQPAGGSDSAAQVQLPPAETSEPIPVAAAPETAATAVATAKDEVKETPARAEGKTVKAPPKPRVPEQSRASATSRAREAERPPARATVQPRVVAPPPAVTVQQPPPRDTQARPMVTAPPPAAAVIPAPPPPARPVETQTEARPAPREEIAAAVAAYASAIESRDINAVRRAYPGITGDQARGFEQFFQSARNINVTFRVTDVEVNGNNADARLVGTYQYITSDGRTERQPVSFGASLRYDGSAWRLRSVR